MPFVTEELWSRNPGRSPLALSPWPEPGFEDEAAAAEINWVVELITAIRSVRSEMNVPAGAMVPLSVSGATQETKTRLATHDVILRRLARIEAIDFAEEPVKGAVQLHLGDTTLSLPLGGVVDLGAEKQRLEKELERIAKEIVKIEAKLGNAQFLEKAPEAVVEEQRERRLDTISLREKTEAALRRLSA
jgi:valyl-tRNA synthetase